MQTVTIKVTQEDIDKGTRLSPYYCPIALAASRVFDDDHDFRVIVLPDRIIFRNFNSVVIEEWTLPPEARDFIRRHNNSQQVTPITFDMTGNLIPIRYLSI
jgi:hypothetical protein